MQLEWVGEGENERAFWRNQKLANTTPIVVVDPRYFRPAEVASLMGDATKARNELGWVPKIAFEDLVQEMTDADLKIAQQELKISF